MANAAVQAQIARKTQQKPADGSTHWSCRKMAAALGLSKSTVQRVWAQARLKPHRLDRYMASDDPRFEQKAADIIGLYMNPPQHAAVFCVDEKTAIQALDRLDPVLPLSPGRAERHGFEYYRHGTLSHSVPIMSALLLCRSARPRKCSGAVFSSLAARSRTSSEARSALFWRSKIGVGEFLPDLGRKAIHESWARVGPRETFIESLQGPLIQRHRTLL